LTTLLEWAAPPRLLLTTALLFAVLVGLEIHGYSISAWREIVDGSPAEEILIGEPQPIRADDWNTILPMAMAQVAHRPRYPVVNRNIGLGQNMLVPFPMPVCHPLTLFRPDTWGFFLGNDIGMAWLWWSRLLGLFVVWTLVFQVVTGGRNDLSLLGGLTLMVSPFFQFWCLRPAPVAIFGGIAFLAALRVVFSRRRVEILLWGAALGWAGAAFVLSLYPPFQVPLAYLVALLFAALLWEHRSRVGLWEHLGTRCFAVLIACASIGIAAWLLVADAGEAIETMRRTVFPGHRASTGGGRTIWELIGPNLLLSRQVSDWRPLANVCEAASFWIASPAVLAAAVWQGWKGKSGLGAVEFALSLLLLLMVVHGVVGLPPWLARASLLDLVPGHRSMIGLGLVDALLFSRLLARNTRRDDVSVIVTTTAATAWALFLAVGSARLAATLPDFRLEVGLALALVNGAAVWIAARGGNGRLPLVVVAVGSLLASAGFNPVVRGGSAYLVENPLSQKILEIDRQHGGESAWLVFGSPHLPNLFRVLGVRAVNGLHPVPQFELWEELDPAHRHRRTYNRYANIVFHPVASRPFMVRTAGHRLLATVDPENRALRELGVTHALLHGGDADGLSRYPSYQHLATVGGDDLFVLHWEDP
jgi:hypothetical protein